MNSPLISRRDIEFLLYELFDAEGLTRLPRFNDHSRETFDAVINTAEAIALDYFAPFAAKLDANEPQFKDGRVKTIPELREALDQYYQAGFGAAGQDEDLGGMQLPFMVSVVCKALFGAANVSAHAYPSLTGANANVIKNFASEVLKQKFLAPLLDGRFMGTMALTEPQAGSSLADLRTTATPDGDVYRLRGNKIFISGGDHDLSDNIVHLVLARIKDAPAGIRGISLFLVPKFLVNDDGTPGDRNDVHLGGLIHKMGYRGTTSTMLNFGEQVGAIGYLIGEPHQGLRYMFQMMNEARIGVGVGAVALGYTAYLQALDYARERPQGRAPDNKDPHSPPLPIIEHADVRRQLLQAKSYVEGGLSLALYGAQLVDQKAWSDDENERQKAATLLDILTPVLKSWPSRYCLQANDIAIQIHGGYGYTREYPLERLYRDNRLNPIHEGTEGIQSMDLLGRKVLMNNGEPLRLFCQQVTGTIETTKKHSELKDFSDALAEALDALVKTTQSLSELVQQGDLKRYLANSALYLDAFGHIVMAWLWLQQAQISAQKTDPDAQNFYQGKVQTCQYFFRWELPKVHAHFQLLKTRDDTIQSMSPDMF